MCSPAALAGAQGGAGVMSAYAQHQQGKQAEEYYGYLARQTEKQKTELDLATDEQLKQVNFDASLQTKQIKEATDQTISSQKAAMAANGVYSDSGTFSDIVDDSVEKQALDEAAVKFNADQAMWQTKRQNINQKLELDAQKTTYRIQGSNARAAANMNAMSTLIGSATQAGTTYYMAKK